jgi:hypothetical protein
MTTYRSAVFVDPYPAYEKRIRELQADQDTCDLAINDAAEEDGSDASCRVCRLRNERLVIEAEMRAAWVRYLNHETRDRPFRTPEDLETIAGIGTNRR